jgi:hypothetical protein
MQARHSVISLAALPICTTMQRREQLDVSVGLTAQRHRGGERLEGFGGDGEADQALSAAFRYFVGSHSLAIRCASAI